MRIDARRALGLIALMAGVSVTYVGVHDYEAWWTIAFTPGGLAIAALTWRGATAGRAIVTGVAFTAALLMLGMGIFAVVLGSGYASWLAAGIGLIVGGAVLLLVLVRRRGR